MTHERNLTYGKVEGDRKPFYMKWGKDDYCAEFKTEKALINFMVKSIKLELKSFRE